MALEATDGNRRSVVVKATQTLVMPIDDAEGAAEERAEDDGQAERDAGDEADRRCGRGPGGSRSDQRDETEGTRGGVLRRIPERTRQAVDGQALENPGRHRVDVEVANGGEGQIVACQPDEGEEAFRAGRNGGDDD